MNREHPGIPQTRRSRVLPHRLNPSHVVRCGGSNLPAAVVSAFEYMTFIQCNTQRCAEKNTAFHSSVTQRVDYSIDQPRVCLASRSRPRLLRRTTCTKIHAVCIFESRLHLSYRVSVSRVRVFWPRSTNSLASLGLALSASSPKLPGSEQSSGVAGSLQDAAPNPPNHPSLFFV